jgi:hypothetical protein
MIINKYGFIVAVIRQFMNPFSFVIYKIFRIDFRENLSNALFFKTKR